MKILPNSSSSVQEQDSLRESRDSATGEDSGFGVLFSSFIEDGRFDYTGRPPGFAAFEKLSGTLGNNRADLFKDALLQRNVSEESILGLQDRVMSGAPLTIGTAFSALLNKERRSDGLNEQERDSFKTLMGKLGLSKDDVDGMLDMSAEGNGDGVLRKLQSGLSKLDGSLDVTRKEFSSLVRSLDLDESTQKKLFSMFGDGEEASLSASELEAFLNEAGKEFALRQQQDRFTLANMRPAMLEALEAAKIQEQTAPVEDRRGDRRSEQLESFMQDSVLKKSGADRIKQDFGNEDDFSHGRKSRDSAWRTPVAEAETRSKSKNGGRESSVESAADRLLQRFDLSGSLSGPGQAAGQARNLDSIARNYRQEIFSQVENGILQNAQNGSQRISLQLTPEDLGRVTIALSMHKGELTATITAENQESASVLGEQLAELKASLEAEGIKVKELDVQTELQDNRFAEQWSEQQNHNFLQDAQERDRIMRLSRLRREQGQMEDHAGGTVQAANMVAAGGLHIVA